MRHQNFSIYLSVIILTTVILLICGCASTPSYEPVAQSNTSPQVIVQGENPKEEIQTIELDNCDGKGDATRTEQRSQSIDVTISAELAAKLGASAEVISAEVQAAVGIARTEGAQRSTSIQLVAPPRTRMIFQLAWTGTEQIGIVQNLRGSNIPIVFRSFSPTDVRIKNQSDIGCPSSNAETPVITEVRPMSNPQMPTPTKAPQGPLLQPLGTIPASIVKSRAEILVIYDSIYREQGWCSLWNKLVEDNLVRGSCPSAVLQWVHENVDTLNGAENLLAGLQMRTIADIEVSYPACVTFGAASHTGGTIEPWIHNDYIGTNLTMHADSVFTLYFRCDNAWSP